MASASPPEAAHIEAASTAEIAGEEHIDKISDKIVYRVSFVDGSEIHVELPPFATVNDLYKTVSNVRAVPSYRLQLIPSGQPAPVKRSPLKLVDVNSEEFMAVTSRHLELGHVALPKGNVADASFEHYAATAYTGERPPGEGAELETVHGKTVTGGEVREPHGVMFNLFDGEEAPPLEGKVLLRFMVHQHAFALGFGVGTKDMPVNQDPEYETGFFGIYHGGSSQNCCGRANRYLRGSFRNWRDDWMAILVDVEARTMQCFIGLEPFGPLYTDLPEEPLWPVVVLWTSRDAVSLSMSFV